MLLRNLCMTLWICCAGSASAHQTIQHRPIPAYAKSEVVLSVPEPILREAILKGLSTVNERDDPVYQTSGFVSRDASGREAWVPALAEESGRASFGKAYFRDPTHANNIYVHFMGAAIVSSYYFANGKALSYKVSYAIALDAIDASTTRVTIRSVKSEIYIGKELNLHAMGFVPKAESVPGSPLDEYRLLVYVAHLAGVQLTPLETTRENGPGSN